MDLETRMAYSGIATIENDSVWTKEANRTLVRTGEWGGFSFRRIG